MPDPITSENFTISYDRALLATAEVLTPELIHTEVLPKELPQAPLRKDDSICLDFGNHYVGYVTLELNYRGSHPDAPAYLYLQFGETLREITENTGEYRGWISKSWLQEEYLHVDNLPNVIRLPRRYAFRYLKITVIDTSPKYALRIHNVTLDAVSAVRAGDVPPLNSGDPLLDRIDAVSVYTLQECMQSVFEDGPKRDRRLWLGDLRMQALVNYETFRNYDLVKRCLYLFAGMTVNDGRIAACVFTEPVPEPDDTYLMDYAMLFAPTLLEYADASGDTDTLKELYPHAIRQLQLAYGHLDEHHIIPDGGDAFWSFLDWSGLNKQAGTQAVMIYCTRYGISLARRMEDNTTEAYLTHMLELCIRSAMEHFWDPEQQMFVSGQERQVSWATQIWMVLAGVLNEKDSKALLLRTKERNPEIRMVTPYMYHHFIEALLQCGLRERAIAEMKRYWGGMIENGADTFWELYDPDKPDVSPYGSSRANSYCHAWSCSPAYILRRSSR